MTRFTHETIMGSKSYHRHMYHFSVTFPIALCKSLAPVVFLPHQGAYRDRWSFWQGFSKELFKIRSERTACGDRKGGQKDLFKSEACWRPVPIAQHLSSLKLLNFCDCNCESPPQVVNHCNFNTRSSKETFAI